MQRCYECKIAVAYVRSSGVNLIINNIEQIIKRGQKVKLITSNQMGITEPEALESMLDIGVEVKIFVNSKKTFHPKAYIFKGTEKTEYIIGSSNLSRSALIDGAE
jgi:HKD family nuclease